MRHFRRLFPQVLCHLDETFFDRIDLFVTAKKLHGHDSMNPEGRRNLKSGNSGRLSGPGHLGPEPIAPVRLFFPCLGIFSTSNTTAT
jgi:hypothetical protein